MTSERRGQWIYYRLLPEVSMRLAELARALVPGGLITLDQRSTARPATAAALPADA